MCINFYSTKSLENQTEKKLIDVTTSSFAAGIKKTLKTFLLTYLQQETLMISEKIGKLREKHPYISETLHWRSTPS